LITEFELWRRRFKSLFSSLSMPQLPYWRLFMGGLRLWEREQRVNSRWRRSELLICRCVVCWSEQHTFTWSIDRQRGWSGRTGRLGRGFGRPIGRRLGGPDVSFHYLAAVHAPRRCGPPPATAWRARSLTDQDDRRAAEEALIATASDQRTADPSVGWFTPLSRPGGPGRALVYRRLSIHVHAGELTDQSTSFLNEGVRSPRVPTATAGRAAVQTGG